MPLSSTDHGVAVGLHDRDWKQVAGISIEYGRVIGALGSSGEVTGQAEELGIISKREVKLASRDQDTVGCEEGLFSCGIKLNTILYFTIGRSNGGNKANDRGHKKLHGDLETNERC